MAREIPNGAVEIQTGLWLHRYDRVIAGRTYTMSALYSSEGYCFYCPADDHYDEEGNFLDRNYYQYMALAISYANKTYEEINAEFVSIPIEPGIEIA